MFTGFPEATMTYFLNIRFNNYSSYYQQTKGVFIKDVQSPFFQFIDELAPAILKIDPSMEVRPNKCLARIYRDARYTKGQSPLRDHLWFMFRRSGEPRDQSVMYWFELGPESMDWGVGLWGENRPAMDLLRQYICSNSDEFQQIIKSCRLKENHFALSGTDYKRIVIPNDVAPSLKPWYTKRRLYVVKQNLQVTDAYSPDLVNRVAKDFQSLAPLYRLLRDFVDQLQQTE